MKIKILMLGDVFGTEGVGYLASGGRLRRFVRENGISLTVANGENSAEGNGITPTSARDLLDAGVDIITGGNHTFRKKNIFTLLDDGAPLVRPANVPSASPGVGYATVDVFGFRVLVVNLIGQVFIDIHSSSPFDCLDRVLESEKGRYDAVLVDFHAEATSEKLALARYADGRVSALVGTHTHIPTSDACVLPGGTGYITDLGMCGSHSGIIGVTTEAILHRFRLVTPVTFEPAKGDVSAEGAVFEIELPSGRCLGAEQIKF